MAITARFEAAATHHGELPYAERAERVVSDDARLFAHEASAIEAIFSGSNGAGISSGVSAVAETAIQQSSKSQGRKKRDEASLNRTLLQIQLQEQYDALIDRQNWLADEMTRLKGEIGAIDRGIAFLQRFQGENDLLDNKGELKPEVERYVREHGKNPNEMTPQEVWVLMQQREADSHDARAEKVDQYNDHAEESRANAEKLDQIEDRAADAGVAIDSAERPDIEAVKPLVREYAPGDAADVEGLSWLDNEKAAVKAASQEVDLEQSALKGGSTFGLGGL